MAISVSAIVLVLMLSASAHASTFLGAHPQVEMQSIPTVELEQMLRSEFHSDARLTVVASELQPLYTALPKNEVGRLEPSVVRYALHRHFAQKYGWHLRGLEQDGVMRNVSSTAAIMNDRAPAYIMKLFEESLHGGLGLQELAMFAVVLSDLIHKEAASDLENVVDVMGLPIHALMPKKTVAKLLKIYLMTYISGVHTPRNSSDDFVGMESTMESDVIVWFDAKMWAEDLHMSSFYSQRSQRNPFVNEFSFEDIAEAAQDIGHHFGAFQNRECVALKDKLVEMEHGGSGRVLLSKFYSGSGVMDWPFIESVDYLRNVGALDDSDPQRLSVIIPNFLSGPSNCETPSNFYSVCCIDECEHLLRQVEVVIAEPSATAIRLVEVISGLQSGTVEAPRNLSSVQVDRLSEIATHHGGQVPLHGRLFAQWMHHAYPRECRFPHVAGSTSPLSQKDYERTFGMLAEASDEEIALHSESENSTASSEVFVAALPWSHAEELLSSHRERVGEEASSATWKCARLLALCAPVLWLAMAKKHVFVDDCRQEKYLV